MTARRLAVLIAHLPHDSRTIMAAREEDGPAEPQQQQPEAPQRRRRVLEDAPVISPREAMRFINANGHEFDEMTQR